MTEHHAAQGINVSNFNSHPHIEDDHAPHPYCPNGKYFNSHPHIEDDGLNATFSALRTISIHILI